MEKFGTLEKLKKSDLKQLTEVEGIGPARIAIVRIFKQETGH